MSLIGELAVNVVAKTQKFRKQMKDSKKSVGEFVKSAKAGIGTLAKFGSAITGISFAGLLIGFNKSRTEIDKLVKTAAKLKVPVGELQALNIAADRNGIAAESFNTSLQRMTRRISEAAQGSGVLVKVLEKMNLDAKELAKLNPAQQFEMVNAALANVPDADKIRTAFAFFDSDGVNNIRLAGQNMNDFRDELKRLGTEIGPEGKKVVELNDAVARLSEFFRGKANRLVVDISPALVRGLDQLERILGVRPDDRREGLAAPSTNAAVATSLGFGSVGEAEMSRSDIQNPLRSVFREMFSSRDLPSIAGPGRIREQMLIEQRQLEVQEQMADSLSNQNTVEIGR